MELSAPKYKVSGAWFVRWSFSDLDVGHNFLSQLIYTNAMMRLLSGQE